MCHFIVEICGLNLFTKFAFISLYSLRVVKILERKLPIHKKLITPVSNTEPQVRSIFKLGRTLYFYLLNTSMNIIIVFQVNDSSFSNNKQYQFVTKYTQIQFIKYNCKFVNCVQRVFEV